MNNPEVGRNLGEKDKRKAESIGQGMAPDFLRVQFNHLRFTRAGNSDQGNFANTEHAEKSRVRLEALRKRYGVAPQVQPSDSRYDQAGPSGASSSKAEPSDIIPIESRSQTIRPLSPKEKRILYDMKHEMKVMGELPSEPPTGDPYVETSRDDCLAFQRTASAYISAGVIDCDFTEFCEKLKAARDYLARSVKPGEALEELMKAPDNSVAYDSQTETLIQNFGGSFPDAARIIRKSPQAMQLVDEAAKAGVEFGGYAEKMDCPYCVGKHVFIPQVTTDPVVATRDFLFELTNGIRGSTFEELDDQASKGTITEEDYVSRNLEIEREGVLKIGKLWSQIKGASKNPTKLDAYDTTFFLQSYQSSQEGKDNIIKVMRENRVIRGSTHEEHYKSEYKRRSTGGRKSFPPRGESLRWGSATDQ